VTPQHLLLNRSAYEALGSLAPMNLPLREEKDNQQLWQALVDGVIYSMAPDHAPHTLREKALPCPPCTAGTPQVCKPVSPHGEPKAQAGRCSLADVSPWLSQSPAELYGLEGKGRLQVGWDGDLTVVNPHTTAPVRNLPACSSFTGLHPSSRTWKLPSWPPSGPCT